MRTCSRYLFSSVYQNINNKNVKFFLELLPCMQIRKMALHKNSLKRGFTSVMCIYIHVKFEQDNNNGIVKFSTTLQFTIKQ